MEPVRETQKKYCSRAMAAAILSAFVLILAGQKGLGKGLVLGRRIGLVTAGQAQGQRHEQCDTQDLSACLDHVIPNEQGSLVCPGWHGSPRGTCPSRFQ